MPNSEDEFYLHVFAPSMPDTDWSNPKLRERYYQIARHYVDLGVDGFRMDAISHLAKNPTFEDSPLKAGKEGYVLDPSEFSNRPELLGYLKEFREKGFRNCIENHDHSKGRCGWIARHDRRMGYGNGAWVKFIDELSKDKPNKVRAWEYFSEAEKINRELAMERFDAMLDDPDGWRGWYCGPRDGRFGPRDGWHGPRDGWREGPRDGRWAPRHHWGGGHFRHGCGPDGWHGGPRHWDGPAY